jgi:hypothetical protein
MATEINTSTAQRVLSALERYDLKPEGKDKYRCNSPLRPGSNSKAFTLTISGPEIGAYYDHVSQDKGSLYELAQQMGIPINAVTPVENSKRDYTGMRDYAKAHGIDDAILLAWHWRETDHKGRRALEFPTRTGVRWRFLDGRKPHYISEPGYVRCWYGLAERMLQHLRKDKTLVICNGEISTIAAQAYNLCAIAVTGGEKEIPANLITELQGATQEIKGLKVVVAMDCDQAGRRASRMITEQLQAAGFNVRAVDLALGAGGDLADFVKLYQENARTQLDRLADLPPLTHVDDRNFRFFTLDEVLALPPIKWLVRGVLPASGLSMIYGPSGVGKSFYALKLAYDLAFHHNIIYVAAEGESGMGIRMNALIKHWGRKPERFTFVLGQVDLFDDEELTTFKGLAAQYKPALITVDTFAMCTGVADENSARDMKTIIDGCKRMAKTLECAVMIVHHTNKAGREPRGSGSLFNACETVIRLTRSDDVLVVESQKTKDLKSFDPVFLKEVSVQLGEDDEGNTVTSLVLLPAEQVISTEELTPLQRTILDALIVDPSTSVRDLASLAEVGQTSIYRAIKKLQERGLVSAYENGQRNVTEAGKASCSAVPPVPPVPPASENDNNPEKPGTPGTPGTLEHLPGLLPDKGQYAHE